MRLVRWLLLAGPVCAACLALRLIDLGIRRWGVKRSYRLLARISPQGWRRPGLSRLNVDRVGGVVLKANWLRQAFCLRRALLIWWLLRWFGVDSDIYCDTGIESGHAWVEAGGTVVGDRKELRGTGRFGRFSVLFAIDKNAAPAAIR